MNVDPPVYEGPMVVTTPGTHISEKTIVGPIVIQAPYVVIKDCIIRAE